MTSLFDAGGGRRRELAGGPVWTFEPPGRTVGSVLVLHHRDGLDDCTADVVTRLLGHGFAVAVPDLFAGQPSGLTAPERKQLIRDDEVLPVLAEATALLARAGRPVAALGFCTGGRLAFLAGVAGIGVRRVCAAYGGDIDRGWGTPVAPLDRVGADAAATQLHRGSRDSNATDAQAQAAVAAFDRAGGFLEATAYAGCRHAFANPYAEGRYHPVAAARLWTAMLSFLAPPETPAGAQTDAPTGVSTGAPVGVAKVSS